MKTRELVICALFASIIAVLAQIAIPLPGGVPLTMQTLAISLAGIILGSKKGFIASLIYVLMGTIGLPVFSEMSGGIGIVLGPTGGFIISFPVMAYVIGLFAESWKSSIILFIGITLASVINYGIGMIQFSVVTGSSMYHAFMVAVMPFIIVGIIKSVLSIILGVNLKKHKGIRGILNYDRA